MQDQQTQPEGNPVVEPHKSGLKHANVELNAPYKTYSAKLYYGERNVKQCPLPKAEK